MTDDARQDDGSPTWPGGWDEVVARRESRRAPLRMRPGEGLPPVDADLAAMAARTLPDPGPRPERASSFALKRHALAAEFAGASELALTNGLTIACLRRMAFPDHAPALFLRIWAEQSAHLIATLETRWLISSVSTFADFGETEIQRHVGRSMMILLDTMKLYESERLWSGRAPSEPFGRKGRSAAPLPLDMPRFSLRDGGLDVNLLAPIWEMAEPDPLIGPLACHLLERLNRDPGTLFRRLALMRAGLRAGSGGG